MASIDERIVEMKFDNKQFENNVQTTMNSLDNLKKNLNMDKASKEFDKIDRASDNVSFEALAKNIDNIAKRFTTFGIIGMTVLQDLTSAALRAGVQIYRAVSAPLIEGGKRRAQNIEQAKFQIEGLGYAWEDVIDDINYGVKDTAYGLDSAAKAASQLLASQVKVGDQMKASLRAISGVAAMTNSEYDDIASIFTTVAGNGKVMSEQLMQMSSRGLNAAATLGEQLGKTEAEIRDMVSKGKIDFNTFATAMDSAFGEHAKKANETFSGAFSNMKAALSRIGANFATPAYQKLRDVMNSLTPVIDEVNKALTPLISLWTQALTVVAKFTSELLTNFKPAVQKHLAEPISNVRITLLNFVETAKNVSTLLGSFFAPIVSGFSKSFKGVFDILRVASSRFAAFSAHIVNMEEAFEKAGKNIRSRIEIVGSVVDYIFTKVLPIGLGSFLNSISGISSIFEDFGTIITLVKYHIQMFVTQLSEAENLGSNLKNIFDGFFSIIRLGVAILRAVSSAFLEFAKVLSQNLGYDLGDRVSGIFQIIGDAGSGFSDFVDVLIERINDLSDSFNSLIREGTILGSIIDIIGALFSKIIELGSGIKSLFSGIEFSFDGVYDIFTKLYEIFSQVFKKISESFETFIQSINFSDILEVLNTAFFGFIAIPLGKIARSIMDFFEGLKDGTSLFGDTAKKISEVLDAVSGSLESWQEKIDANNIKSIAIAIGILAVALVVLSRVDTDKLVHALGALAILFAGLYRSLDYFSALDLANFNAMPLIAIATAITILSIALAKIGQLDVETLIKGLIGVGVALVELAGFMTLATEFGKISPADSIGLIGLAAALIVLGSAVEKFGSMDPETMLRGLVACGLAILELVAFTDRVGGQERMISIGIGLMAIAAAMIIFSKAVEAFGSTDPEVLIMGLSAMGLALVAISAAMMLMPSEADMVATGAGMVLIATSMVILSKAFESFGQLSITEMVKSLVMLAGSLTAIAVAMIFMKGTASGAAALLLVSAALGALAPVLLLFGSMSIEQIVKSLAMLAGVFAVLWGAGVMLGPIVPTLVALAGALALMGVAALAAGAGAMMISTALVALATSGVGVVAAVEEIVKTVINLIPELFRALGQGLIELFNMLADGGEAMFNAMSTIIQSFLNALTSSLPAAFNLLSTFLNGVLDIIEQLFPRVVSIVTMAIDALLSLIETYIPRIIEIGFTLITSFLTSIRDNIGEITVLAGEIIVNFLNGISQELPNIINSAMELALSFIRGLTDAIKNNGSELVEAALELLVTIIEALIEGIAGWVTSMWDKGAELFDGFVGGIGSMLDDAKNAAMGIAQGALDAVKDFVGLFTGVGEDCSAGFAQGIKNAARGVATAASQIAKDALDAAKAAVDSNSPAKKFIKLGKDCDEGMRLGIVASSKRVSKEGYKMASGAIDRARSALSGLQDLFDVESDLNPVITPIMDLSNIERGADGISRILSKTDSISASLNASVSGFSNIPVTSGRNYGNRDVVSAINKLSTNLDKLQNGSTTIINGVTYDDGSGISNAVGQLVEAVIVDGRM